MFCFVFKQCCNWFTNSQFPPQLNFKFPYPILTATTVFFFKRFTQLGNIFSFNYDFSHHCCSRICRSIQETTPLVIFFMTGVSLRYYIWIYSYSYSHGYWDESEGTIFFLKNTYFKHIINMVIPLQRIWTGRSGFLTGYFYNFVNLYFPRYVCILDYVFHSYGDVTISSCNKRLQF